MSRSRRRPKAGAGSRPDVAASRPEAPASVAVAASIETERFLSARVTIVLIIVSATILRLAAAPFGRYFEDSQVLAFRAERLARLPISELYATNQGVIGHLPGDLWLLWYVSNFGSTGATCCRPWRWRRCWRRFSHGCFGFGGR